MSNNDLSIARKALIYLTLFRIVRQTLAGMGATAKITDDVALVNLVYDELVAAAKAHAKE